MIPIWTATQHGFFSAVEHRTDKTIVFVRSRAYQDSLYLANFKAARLEAAGEQAKAPADYVIEYAHSDYPWRVEMTKGMFADFLYVEALGIDYGNFKNAVTAKQGKARHDIYSRVWAVLLDLEKISTRKKVYVAPAPATYAKGKNWWDDAVPARPKTEAVHIPATKGNYPAEGRRPSIPLPPVEEWVPCASTKNEGKRGRKYRSWQCSLMKNHPGKHESFGGHRKWS